MANKRAGLKRRDFLASIGRAAGSAAVIRAMVAMGIGTAATACGGSSSANPAGGMSSPPPNAIASPRPGDWPANVGLGRSVVILGGGIAGMTAALELTRLGYDCSILEARSVAGGRNRTLRAGDVAEEIDSTQACAFDADPALYFNPGPARIPHHHEFLLGYCREFGVLLEPFINDNRAALLHSSRAFGGVPQVARRVVSDTRGNIAALLASAIDQGALDQLLSATDRINVLAMLASYGALDGSFTYAGTTRAGYPGQEDRGSRRRGESLSPLDFSELVGEAFFQSRADFAEDFEQQPTMLQPSGGMDRIGVAFADAVAASFIFEAQVTEIRKSADGARVVYRDRFGTSQAVDADYCICTIPATVLRDIPNDFSNAHATAIAAFSYAQATKIAFQSRRFWEQDHNIYGGISWTTQDITQIWYPSAGFGQETGIVVGSYIFGGPAGSTFSNQSPQQRVNSTVTQANAVHAEFGAEAGRGISVAWPKVPFQRGAWGVSDPGVLLLACFALVSLQSKRPVPEVSVTGSGPLTGTNWRAVRLLGNSVPSEYELSASFSDDGQFRGSAGCNLYSGRYERNGKGFKVAAMRATQRGCDAQLTAVEKTLFEVYRAARKLAFVGEELRFLDTNGEWLATFAPASDDPRQAASGT
jgi:monoamine oxidase